MDKPKNLNNSDMHVSLNQNLFISITDTGAFRVCFCQTIAVSQHVQEASISLNDIKYLKIVHMQCELLLCVSSRQFLLWCPRTSPVLL